MTQFNMVDSPQGPDPKRLLLAVVVTSAVLMVYSYFFAPEPKAPVAQVEQKEEIIKALPVAELPLAADANTHVQATPANIVQKNITFAVMENSDVEEKRRTSYRAQISNIGGLIDRYALVGFSQERVLFDEEKLGSFLLKISSKKPAVALDDNAPYEVVSEDKSHIKLRHVTKEGLEIERYYQFLDNATIQEQITWKNLSNSPLKVEPVFSAIKSDKKTAEPGFFNPGVQGESIAVEANGKYEKFGLGDLKDKPKSFSNIRYVAFDDQFFLAAIIPKYQDAIDHVEMVVHETENNRKIAKLDLLLKPFVLTLGEQKVLSHQFFIGPKQVDLLASFSVPLDENIDFGWFGILSRPMLWLLVQIYGFVKNYGLAIIIITFIIKLLTYPLTQKSFSSQQEMKKMQPQIKELQQKFGHDRTLLGQKQMELYRSHGVNPVAGCLPMLIQLPIWFAFFQMLRNSVELFDQPFYWWITDLTRPDQYFVLPVLMGASMLIQQAFTPPPTDQPHMKYVMWAMPIFLTFIMLNMPSGLSLYILTNNLLTIVQQIIIKRQTEKMSA